MNNFLEYPIVRVLGSFGLAAALLILLMIVTLFGTLAQADHTLYDVQRDFFGSYFHVYHVAGKYPLPLPGGLLLLPLLFLNLLLGGLIRMRKGTSTIGVFIVHLGIVVLLAGSWVEHQFKTEGFLQLYEGESSDEYLSYTDWEIVVVENRPDGSAREYVIPHERFTWLDEGDTARFQHADLPFTVVLSDYHRNSTVRPANPGEAGQVEGYVLQELPAVKKADEDRNRRNVAGLEVTVVDPEGGTQRGILWGRENVAFTPDLGGGRWALHLQQQRWQLPFDIHLDKFVHEYHPGTGTPRRFSSYVRKSQAGSDREIHITMNEPLRESGYTLYQSGWGPQEGRPDRKMYSVFSVVGNPSDRVPWIATAVIALGLVIHFGLKLWRYLKNQARREATARSAA